MVGLSLALEGLTRSEALFSQAARTIARAPLSADSTDTVDLSAAAVALLTARNNFEATTKFIKTSDEMEQSLINTLV
jgi:flagellar hook protein FlgE